MQRRFNAEVRSTLLALLFIIGLAVTLFVAPRQFLTEANGNKGLITRTVSEVPGLPKMYDIRDESNAKNEEARQAIVNFRSKAGKGEASVSAIRTEFVAGEQELRNSLPTAKVEYNTDIRTPEVITPDVWRSKIEFLSRPSNEKRSEILRGFIKQYDRLIGVSPEQVDALKVAADYTNPDGNMSYAHLAQEINGVEVFRGEVKAGFTRDGRIVRVINNLAPGLDYSTVPTDFGDPANAVRVAAAHINHQIKPEERSPNASESKGNKVVFGSGDWATTAEKMYFPTEPGVAVAAWRVLIWDQPAFYVIVEAETGTVLWHKNIQDDQAQSATYNVYNNPNSYLKAADSPAPLSPGPLDPTLGTQGVLGTRTNVTLVGNESPYIFNNNGWITDGANITDGNALEAGIDRDGTNGVDAPQTGSPSRNFTAAAWNPPPGSPAPGDAPLTPDAQRGAVIQMFYVMNRYHDEMYLRGFTEAARNFQATNFSGQGVGNDRVSAEGQDSSGTNNANFATPADGGRGRMQMFLWTGPTPDYDGTADAEVIIHEVTHGTSNRLHGNGSGLGGNFAGGMGEGWSDFYSYTLLAEPTDPINAIYTTGGYATYLIAAGFTGNYYYGIRRFPRAPITFLGTNGKPHNPYTFRYLNSDCNTLIGTTTSNPPPNSAFPRGPIGVTQCDQVHNVGEIWSSMLWEIRNRMVTRLGFTAGTARVLQVVTDGMKLAPLSPTFIQERDAIIAAAAALPIAPEASLDVQDVREGFRVRGLGFSASIQTASPIAVTEAFDFPNVRAVDPFSISDSTGDNDGFPEPGEPVLVSVPVQNPNTGSAITSVQVNINGGTNVSYGTINDGQTVTNQIPFTIPANTPCGSEITLTFNVSSSAGTQAPTTKNFRIGVPAGGAPVTFTNSTSLTLPDGSATTPAPSVPYGTTVNVSGVTFGNANISFKLNGYSQTFPGDNDFLLVGPGGQKFEPQSDQGGSNDVVGVTYSLEDAAATAIPTAIVPGTFRPTADTSTDIFAAPAPAGPYTLPAPGGTGTFGSVFGTSGAPLNGTWTLYVVDDAGGDTGTISGGWSLTISGNDYACGFNAVPRSRADFDGDGKSDMSVFRPSTGEWYALRSTAGFMGVKWGTTGDIVVPGDYDGDGKADFAVWRPSDTANVTDFFVLNSNGFTISGYSHGLTTDVPVAGDFDGDGKSDIAVWRPSNGNWFIWGSQAQTTTTQQFGSNGDIPLAIDKDGDGKANLSVYRPSINTFFMANSTGTPAQNFTSVQWGLAGDVLVPADYDGDNKEDVAVFRPSNGFWYIFKSTGGTQFTQFGANGDVPVPGDYDGDGKDDIGVYRSGTWYVSRSTAGFQAIAFGTATDVPIERRYLATP